jgi:hypothetical protein
LSCFAALTVQRILIYRRNIIQVTQSPDRNLFAFVVEQINSCGRQRGFSVGFFIFLLRLPDISSIICFIISLVYKEELDKRQNQSPKKKSISKSKEGAFRVSWLSSYIWQNLLDILCIIDDLCDSPRKPAADAISQSINIRITYISCFQKTIDDTRALYQTYLLLV